MIQISLFVFAGGFTVSVGVAGAQQFPIMDKLADKVVQKYQSSSCQELIAKKASRSLQRGNVRAESDRNAAQGSTDAHGVPQPRRRSHREQNVRVRHDSLIGLQLKLEIRDPKFEPIQMIKNKNF